VSGEYELTTPFFFLHPGNDAIGNKPIVKIILWLVDYQRRICFQQQEQQYRRRLLAGLQFFESLPLRILTLRGHIQFNCRR